MYSYVSIICCLVTLAVFSELQSSFGEVTEELDSGCSITRLSPGENRSGTSWYEMPLPHLNCSGRGQTRLNVARPGVDDVKSITLSYNDLIQLHVDDLKGFTSLVKIEVKSSKLQRVVASSQDLVLTSVTYLTLTHNYLATIPNDALSSFPNLKVLVLYSNEISIIYEDDFRFNTKLQRLYLGPNPVLSFNDAWMTKLNLTKLSLRGCGLTRLPVHISSLSSLEFADLSDNQIAALPANSFSGCIELRWLEIASNQITTIDKDAFKGAFQLNMLELSDNQIETLVPGTFGEIGTEHLQVDLYENPINCGCSMAWFKAWIDEVKSHDISTEIRYKCEQPARNHGKKSKQLTLDDFTCEPGDVTWQDCNTPRTTQILPTATSLLQPRTCPSLCACYDENKQRYWPPPGSDPTNLDSKWSRWSERAYPSVECISVGLTTIPDDIPVDVKMITLTGNQITTLYLSLLKHFTRLETLDLKMNEIRSIAADSTVILRHVTSLNLRSNKIISVEKDVFWSFPSMEALGLFHNEISIIPSDIFMYNRQLTKLYLGPNPIKSFQEDFMINLNLVIVSLRNMSIIAVPTTLGDSVNMGYCDLSDNLITAVRNTAFSNCAKLAKIYLENNRITTIEENAFNGAMSLRTIKLSENQITTFPVNVFANVSQDRLTVELWENPIECDCNLKDFKSWIETRQAIDTTTDIRFRCDQPLRMHNKLSYQLTPDDFVCNKNDARYVMIGKTCGNVGGKIATAVIVTFICTVLFGIIACKLAFNRRYGHLVHYVSHKSKTENLPVMEELRDRECEIIAS